MKTSINQSEVQAILEAGYPKFKVLTAMHEGEIRFLIIYPDSLTILYSGDVDCSDDKIWISLHGKVDSKEFMTNRFFRLFNEYEHYQTNRVEEYD
jgi:hypothetical protein